MNKVPYETDPDDVCMVYINENLSVKRIIVTAANKVGDLIICGARHHDGIMGKMYDVLNLSGLRKDEEQGFIDQYGQFVTREEAHVIFVKNKQTTKRSDGRPMCCTKQLFSEDLH